MLSDIADYSLGYNNATTGSGNLIVVQAKRRFQLCLAYGQYGFEYHFWRIVNNPNVYMVVYIYFFYRVYYLPKEKICFKGPGVL